MKKVGTIIAVLFVLFLCAASIYVGAFNGEGAKFALPHIQMAPEVLFHIGSFPVSNSMIAVLIVDLLLVWGAAAGTRAIRRGDESALIPSGWQNFVEWVYETLYDAALNVLGEEKLKKLPGVVTLLLTIFIFILVANWIELIPGFETIGWIEPAEEHGYTLQQFGPVAALVGPVVEEGGYTLLPILRAANTDLNVPLMLAIVAVVMVQFYGVYYLGKGYFLRFFNYKAFSHGATGIFEFLASVLEIISEFAKVISFSFRLFGNIFAGSVLLAVMAFLFPFLAPAAFYFLELFVGFIQALVFMMLTASFIAVALAGHGSEHEEEHNAA